MKKLIALLLAVAMLACALCACGSSKTETEVKETAAPAADTQQAADDADEEEAEATVSAMSKKELLDLCTSALGSAVDLDSLGEPEYNDEGTNISYYAYDNVCSTFSYQLTLSGLNLSIDGVTTFQDLADAGWTGNFPETADGHYYYINSVSKDDAWFTITALNAKEETVSIGECFVTSIGLQTKYLGDFSICGLTADSTPANVVAALGNPNYVCYSTVTGLTLKFKDDLGSAEFTFSADGKLTDVNFSYSNYNLVG